MANYNFEKDIELGEEGEKVVIKDLELVGGTFINDNKNNTHDLMMEMPIRGSSTRKLVSYEVKTDVFCRPDLDTGNIFIEFESRGKESGISVTKAEWFVTYFKHFNEIWYIKSDKLRKLISENDFKVHGDSGDLGSNTKGYLIPRYQFKKFFKVRIISKKFGRL
jgi:hypothetical protein